MVVVPSNGVLRKEFDAITKVALLPRKPQISSAPGIIDFFRYVVKRILFPYDMWRFRNKLNRFQPDLIFANTIATGEMLQLVSFLKAPVLLHVLEMNYAQLIWGKANLEQVQRYAHHVVAINGAVKSDLIQNGFEAANISIIELPVMIKPQAVAEQHHTKSTELVVGASGTIEWRKGADLFILLAKQMCSLQPERKIKFRWLGKPVDEAYLQQLKYDLQKAEVAHIVEFLPSTPDPLSVYKTFDVFVLTAREEPFGLAAAECAAMGIPVIMFEKAGGFESFVAHEAAMSVPFPDTSAMANTILGLVGDQERLQHLRRNANRYISDRHDTDKNFTAMLELISSISETPIKNKSFT